MLLTLFVPTMARIARVVVPDFPYHVTHRGNRRSNVFFDDGDRELYLAILSEHARRQSLAIWAYCLMTNHVHLIVVPEREDSMAKALGPAHMQYSRRVNQQRGWCGHLWANRYHSTLLDGEHLWTAVRYVEQNPLRAGMVNSAQDYQWSSCRQHAGLAPEIPGLLAPGRAFPGWVTAENWVEWVNAGLDEGAAEHLRTNTLSGRPCGDNHFVSSLEKRLGRPLTQPKMGRPRKAADNMTEDLLK